MPYWDDPKYNDPEEIEGPDDVHIPVTAHHMQAQAELNLLMETGALDEREVEEALAMWRAKKEVTNEDRVEAAVDVLLDSDAIDEDLADDILA